MVGGRVGPSCRGPESAAFWVTAGTLCADIVALQHPTCEHPRQPRVLGQHAACELLLWGAVRSSKTKSHIFRPLLPVRP